MKTKVAFVKFGGMAVGGTEKVLQTIAANLPKDIFEVDYYYCDAAPYIGSDWKHPDTEQSRVEYTSSHDVNLIKFDVGFKNVLTPTHEWVDTNFWELFEEEKYDLVVTGRAGHPEYPFCLMHKVPIIDTIHLAGMAENKPNTYKTVLISKEQRDKWISAGGQSEKSTIIANPVYCPKTEDKHSYPNKFVFGLHQRDNDQIFSSIPLEAYSKIESDSTMFLFLGGSKLYQDQAKQLGIKNIVFLPSTPDLLEIHKFLNSLDVYAHGRSDGEQCSTAIIEAMSHGLPVVSHFAPSNGHVEQISDTGEVVENVEQYAKVLIDMMSDGEYYSDCVTKTKERYLSEYSMDAIIEKYSSLFMEATK